MPLPRSLVRWGTRALVGLNLLAALLNFASSSPWERFLWGPVALVEAVLCLIVARSGSPPVEKWMYRADFERVAARYPVFRIRGNSA
jgi:hypothetical protein